MATASLPTPQFWKENNPNQKLVKENAGTVVEPSQGDTSEATTERISSFCWLHCEEQTPFLLA